MRSQKHAHFYPSQGRCTVPADKKYFKQLEKVFEMQIVDPKSGEVLFTFLKIGDSKCNHCVYAENCDTKKAADQDGSEIMSCESFGAFPENPEEPEPIKV